MTSVAICNKCSHHVIHPAEVSSFFWLPSSSKMFLAQKLLGGLVNVIGWECAQFIFLQPKCLHSCSLYVTHFSFRNIDPSQFIPSEPVSNHDWTRSLSVDVPLTSSLFTVLWSLHRAGLLCLQNRMRARRRSSSAKSSSSSLGTWVLFYH